MVMEYMSARAQVHVQIPRSCQVGQAAGMDKKCDNSKGEAARKQAAEDGVPMASDNWSCKLITGSPTEVNLQHPLFTHSLVVNTSAVSALASRGRLLGPWVAWAWPLHSLWSPCPWWPSEAPRDS
jgi:hypothetical protein